MSVSKTLGYIVFLHSLYRDNRNRYVISLITYSIIKQTNDKVERHMMVLFVICSIKLPIKGVLRRGHSFPSLPKRK